MRHTNLNSKLTLTAAGTLFALSVLMLPAPAQAVEPVNTGLFGNVAIQGFDPVAYFTDGKAVKGDKEHELEWQGATWRFASAEHRDLFAADPEKYAPQFGGYCAYAVAHGKTASIHPEAFTVRDGKLYLNYNKKVQKQWEADVETFIAQANENWPEMVKE